MIATPGPGFKEGVLFDGMTADGSKVFFTTKDALSTASNQDTDNSADLYQAEVSESGHLTLTRISTGDDGTGNTDACEPVSNANGPHWNAVGSEADCGVVAIGGGGGVAAEAARSTSSHPSSFDGAQTAPKTSPTSTSPPLAQPPRFIATLSPEDPLVLDSVKEAEVRHTAGFQVTPIGEFAVFTTT